MAEEEEEGGEESSPKEDKKASLEWKKMPKWEKAGVVIAGATLVIMVFIWWKSQQGGGAVSSGQLPMGGYPPTYSGSQDMFPAPPSGPGQPNPQPPPAPSPGPGNNPGSNPLTPLFPGAPPAGFKDVLGNWYTGPNGLIYTIVPGANGRIWGFNGQLGASAAQKLSQQPNNGMVLLFQQ